MALTSDGLSTIIQANLQTIGNITNPSEMTAFANALAKAIVTYIQTSAQVSGTVTTGQGAGGVVIGTVL